MLMLYCISFLTHNRDREKNPGQTFVFTSWNLEADSEILPNPNSSKAFSLVAVENLDIWSWVRRKGSEKSTYCCFRLRSLFHSWKATVSASILSLRIWPLERWCSFVPVSRMWQPVCSKPSPGCLHSHSAVKFLNAMILFGGELEYGLCKDHFPMLSFLYVAASVQQGGPWLPPLPLSGQVPPRHDPLRQRVRIWPL